MVGWSVYDLSCEAALIWLLFACTTDTTGWLSEVHGRVVDVYGEGIEAADVVLSDGQTGDWLGAVETESDGNWRMPVLFREQGGFPVVIEVTSEGMTRGLSWAEVFLEVDDEAKSLYAGAGQSLDMFEQRMPPVLLVADGLGWGAGSLVDASNGVPVPRVSMSLRAGWNAPESQEVMGDVSTDLDGLFRIEDFPAGVYTASVEAGGGYSGSRFRVVVEPEGADNQVGMLSRTLESGQLRAALTWSRSEIAVGLHVSGPLSVNDAGRGRYQVHAQHPVHPVRGEPVAAVEHTAPGLESAAVYSLRSSGVYRVSAHILDRLEIGEEASLSNVGAQVQLWWSDGQAMVFPTPGVVGNLWNAIEFDVESGYSRNLQHYEPVADPFDVDAF